MNTCQHVKKISLSLIFIAITVMCRAQAPLSFYQDKFHGGVTAGGYSPAYDATATNTGHFTINIPAGSTIRKAWLFAGRLDTAANITVMLNSLNVDFNPSTQVTSSFVTNYGQRSALCAVDVSSQLSDTATVYALTLPGQNITNKRYEDFYLYVAYNNVSLPEVATAIFFNDTAVTTTVNYHGLSLMYPYIQPGDFGISLFAGYTCNDVTDGSNVFLNGANLGVIGGPDANSGTCGGPIGNFYYNAGTLNGLGDDNEDEAVLGSDALSNASAVLTNNTSSLSMAFVHQGLTPAADNEMWGVIMAYTGGDPTGVPAIGISAQEIYPNPAAGQLTISYHLPVLAISLVNTLGQTVLIQEPANTTTAAVEHINVSHLSEGLYFIKLQTKGGEVVGRFVKR